MPLGDKRPGQPFVKCGDASWPEGPGRSQKDDAFLIQPYKCKCTYLTNISVRTIIFGQNKEKMEDRPLILISNDYGDFAKGLI